MNRKEITKFLSDLLERTVLSGIGIYYASEVVVDYGTAHPKRIDYLRYTPRGALYAGDIENGSFTCYEVKSCKEDVYSGSGLNFLGEENYIVTTMACYKSLLQDINSGKLNNHIREMNGGRFLATSFCWQCRTEVAVKDSMVIVLLQRSLRMKHHLEKAVTGDMLN